MRIARFLAAAGRGSRRACEDLVTGGTVTVNGARVATPATVVNPEADRVCCAGKPVTLPEFVYLVLNKPRGYTCSARDRHARHLVHELLPRRMGRLFTVGRLDRDSEGLLIVTNDGAFAQKLAHPRFGIRKRYRVRCRGRVDRKVLDTLRAGVEDDGEFLQPQTVLLRRRTKTGAELEFVLGEGRKRELRRLCKHVGLTVERLVRTAVGPVSLDGVPAGAWRRLTDSERDGFLAPRS